MLVPPYDQDVHVIALTIGTPQIGNGPALFQQTPDLRARAEPGVSMFSLKILVFHSHGRTSR